MSRALRTRKYGAPERALAAKARKIAKGRRVLYHGTRYAHAILATDTINTPATAEASVSFTRSAEEAAFWALLSRGREGQPEDEGGGAVLIFDRRSLQANYSITLYHDDVAATGDENEEAIWQDVHNVGKHLIGKVETGETVDDAGKRRGLEYGRRMKMSPRDALIAGGMSARKADAILKKYAPTRRKMARAYSQSIKRNRVVQ
jgi:hypothetical protein